MRGSVPRARYSSVCNELRQWRIWLIPTYRVYLLYDTLYIYIYIYIYIYVYLIYLIKHLVTFELAFNQQLIFLGYHSNCYLLYIS